MSDFYNSKSVALRLSGISADFVETHCRIFAKVDRYNNCTYSFAKIVNWLNTEEGRNIKKLYHVDCKKQQHSYQEYYENCTIEYIEWLNVGFKIKGVKMSIQGNVGIRECGIDIYADGGGVIKKKRDNKSLKIVKDGEQIYPNIN